MQHLGHQQELHDLSLFLFLFPCPCLCPCLSQPVEGEEVQPAAVPNEEEGDCIEEGVVEQGKDQHCSHLANQYGQVAMATGAGQCASCEHGVECGGEQDYPKSVVHVRSAVQQFGYVEECWVGFGPCIKIRSQPQEEKKKHGIKTYMPAYSRNDRQCQKLELFHSSRNVRSMKEAVKSVPTVSVESGATSNKGRGGNCKPASPISLHTVP